MSPADETTPPNPLPSPLFTVSPTWPGHSLPPGVTVVDGASGIQRLDWSPNGNLLAVLTWGGVLGTGRADVLDLSGRRLASFDAFDLAWVDDSHLMTLAVSPGDIAHGRVSVHSIDGTQSTVVAGSYGGILGNGHGSVALLAPGVGGGAPPDDSFAVWSNGQLGPRIAGFGRPIRWSPDGQLLALTAEGPPTTGGSHEMGDPYPGTLTVMRLPEQTVVASVPLDDIRLDVYISSDGGRLATSAGVVLDLSNGRLARIADYADGWTPSGELTVMDSSRRISLWTAARTVAIPNAFEWAAFGPTDDDIATLPAAGDNLALPTTAVVRRGGAVVSIQLNDGGGTATWSATGVCFIATGTYDAQVEDDHLLRIELPQGRGGPAQPWFTRDQARP